MKRTRLERFIVFMAWSGLIGGILLGALAANGTLLSDVEMAAMKALCQFFGYAIVSVAWWDALLELVAISDRIGKIENK